VTEQDINTFVDYVRNWRPQAIKYPEGFTEDAKRMELVYQRLLAMPLPEVQPWACSASR